MSPPKRIQPKNYVIATEQISENQTGNKPVLFFSCSINCLTDIQEAEEHTTTTHTGDTTIPLLTITTPLIEEGLVRDEQTNDFYLPLTSTVVQQRKQKMLYVPLDFENNLTVDALVDSGEKSCQNRRLSQFLNIGNQWPVRKTVSNSHT